MPAVFQLLAFPGTGKLTIAKEIKRQLEARGEPVALLDNHATHNLVWQLVPEAQRFDEAVLGRVFELRRVLIEAAAELTSDAHSILFTNFLPPGRPANLLDPHRDLARKLGKPLVAVVLACDRDEVLRRVGNPDRAANLKLDDVEIARHVMDAGQTLPEWPELVELDVSVLSAEEAARRIVAMADAAAD
jgi:adenylate kinase